MTAASKQLRYDTASNPVRVELPAEVKIAADTAIYLTVYDDDGDAIVARAAATRYASTTLSAAVTVGDSSFTLASGAGALEPGDRVRILDSDLGPDEDVLIHHYDSTTRTAYTVESMRASHSSGAAVVGMWATGDIDTSDEDTYPTAKTIILAWEHGSTETSAYKFLTELYQIGQLGWGSNDALDRFATRFPDLALKIQDRRLRVLDEARRELRWECQARNCDIDRVVDQELLMLPLMLKMAVIAAGVSDQYATEREELLAEYTRQFDRFLAMPIWVNHGDDLAKSDDEIQSHQPLTWSRGM